MGHRIRAFVGDAASFSAFRAIAPASRLYSLSPSTHLLVLLLQDDLHDALHRANGTGDWLEGAGPLLSSSDFQFAARASERAPLAYIETDYFGGEGMQHAVLWQHGSLAIGPLTLNVQTGTQRATSLWPINVVLRALGIAATMHEDEFTRLGLGAFRDAESIQERAASRAISS
ncbi:MAG: hypothetical protein ABL898_04345 [Hyphomicrobiaceae bacterium]|nr:hypothetical protein [Hyphomicrobiaceae bacterium]